MLTTVFIIKEAFLRLLGATIISQRSPALIENLKFVILLWVRVNIVEVRHTV